MAHPLSVPAVGALIVAAAAFGVHLGESAIADINPIHFQGPAVHPRDRGAAIDAIAPDTQRPLFASAYGWDEGAEARERECVGCGEVYVGEAQWVPAATYYTQEPAVYSAEEPVLAARADPAARTANFERYAYYPIEAKADVFVEQAQASFGADAGQAVTLAEAGPEAETSF